MAYPNRYQAKHLAILGFVASIASAVTFWGVSLKSESYIGGFHPYLNQAQAGYQIDHGKNPIRNREFYLIMMGSSILMAGLILSADDGAGNALIDLRPDAFRKDFAETAIITGQIFNESLGTAIAGGLSWAVLRGKKTAEVVWLNTAPAQVKTALEKKTLAVTWLKEFLKAPHAWIAGRTRAGKTFLMLWILKEILKADSNVELRIWDIHYLKPDPVTGRKNDWMRLPRSYVQRKPEDIMAAFLAEDEELERRKELGINKPKRIILIDELNSTAKACNGGKGKDGEFSRLLAKFLYESAGYGWKFLLSGQALAVGEADISEDTRRNMALAICGDDAADSDALLRLSKSKAKELAQEAGTLLKQKVRVACVQIPGRGATIQVIPDLSMAPTWEIKTKQPQDADLAWWKSIWTSEKKQWLETLAYRFVAGEIKSPLKEEVCQGFGVPYGPRSPRYARFVADAWRNAVEIAKQRLEKDEE
ncbi:MAG: hypothetical protein KME06_09645 [Kastovskya adunca ATA6-11-RM4]|jgi:hypothetical protein|nr:hypothetical protein [Kastovskya adunca ATA6-11-RM4]